MIGWIDQHRDTGGLGHQIMEESQSLGRNFSGEKIDAGRVAARLGKAGDETKFDGVVADAEDDRDRCGRSHGRLSNAVWPGVAITATRRRTRSAMSGGRRSYRPSSQWYSTITFWPST